MRYLADRYLKIAAYEEDDLYDGTYFRFIVVLQTGEVFISNDETGIDSHMDMLLRLRLIRVVDEDTYEFTRGPVKVGVLAYYQDMSYVVVISYGRGSFDGLQIDYSPVTDKELQKMLELIGVSQVDKVERRIV